MQKFRLERDSNPRSSVYETDALAAWPPSPGPLQPVIVALLKRHWINAYRSTGLALVYSSDISPGLLCPGLSSCSLFFLLLLLLLSLWSCLRLRSLLCSVSETGVSYTRDTRLYDTMNSLWQDQNTSPVATWQCIWDTTHSTGAVVSSNYFCSQYIDLYT